MIIRTPSRIHMGLIDLNGSIGRLDGGIGLALEEPSIKIHAERSDNISSEGLMKSRIKRVLEDIIKYFGIEGGAKVEVLESYPQHVGLGSGTQVSLAVACAILKLYRISPETRELAGVIGRGGTSGIGVAAFDNGGFILDGGHSTSVKKSFLPSSASEAPVAPILARYNFPDWPVLLVIPRKGKKFSGKREVNIFENYCPVEDREVEILSRLILMKLMPAIVEEDIQSFGRAVNQIQKVGFKKIEVSLQAKHVKEILKICQENSYGAGLSSFGPVVYAFSEYPEKLKEILENRKDIERVIITRASNCGWKEEKV